MKITFLGVGTHGTENLNYHSNMLLEVDDKKLLIDCGSDIKYAMKDAGESYKDIDDVYISHLHGDHAGGLEWLGFKRFFDPDTDKPNLFISRDLSSDLWNRTLSGSMRSLQGIVAEMDTYFNVNKIARNGSFSWQGINFRLVQTVHIMDGFSIIPSYGLLFNTTKTVFITADSQFCPHQIKDFYEMSDIIFHDCETLPYKSGVHAHYEDLKTLDDETKEKMWLYHYQDENPYDDKDTLEDGFQGFVKKGQVINLN